MAPVMIGTYESNDRGNDYLSHHPHNAFILATCQKSGMLCSHSIKLGYMLHDTDDPTTIFGHSIKLCSTIFATLTIH